MVPEISVNFRRDHLQRGRQIEVGIDPFESALFDRYLTRRMALFSVTLGDPYITTPFSTFFNAFHIFVTGEVRHFKFGILVYHGMSQSVGEKPSLKRAWSETRDQL